MKKLLNHKERYFQLAFNGDLNQIYKVLPKIPFHERIWIEAGTPLLKREGMNAIRTMKTFWRGIIIADLKISDGAIQEVNMAYNAGARAVTALLSAPIETLNLFIERCENLGIISMIDTLGGGDPLKIIRQLKKPPNIIVLHRGRDEENGYGKEIQYKHISRLRSKYDVLISAAGGIDLKQARSAIFNGANIVVGNIVKENDPWTGLLETDNIAELTQKFLSTVEG
ncbi:MAG: orotidine 5'-phosphate decarboxylase / HUMPS family protein [Alphaproteobacteria bacterium]